ncbi:MAG: hypothetical protein IPK82_41840 [Polyangiaceae bacterium]|nr:hypothetical protein [Polyangiaceae bacterium]
MLRTHWALKRVSTHGRRRLAAAVALAVSTVPHIAYADGAADRVNVCADASEKGQELRDAGKLRAARDLFVKCAAPACPVIVQKDCAGWLADVTLAIPSVVVSARDENGADLSDVTVKVDGEVLTTRLDGHAVEMDAGAYTFRFERAGADVKEESLILRAGEKRRPVRVTLISAAQSGGSFTVPKAAWALGAVSLASFGLMAGFGVSAETAVADMRAPGGCAPRCDVDRVNLARRDMILANVFLGLGAGAAVGGAAIFTWEWMRTPARAQPVQTVRANVYTNGISLFVSF